MQHLGVLGFAKQHLGSEETVKDATSLRITTSCEQLLDYVPMATPGLASCSAGAELQVHTDTHETLLLQLLGQLRPLLRLWSHHRPCSRRASCQNPEPVRDDVPKWLRHRSKIDLPRAGSLGHLCGCTRRRHSLIVAESLPLLHNCSSMPRDAPPLSITFRSDARQQNVLNRAMLRRD